jgi:ferredoxin
MRFRVDPTLCEGYGTCADLAPAVFVLDEWGYAQAVAREVVDEDERAGTAEAMRQCPVFAIREIDSDGTSAPT